jgi:hypothetical protein
MARTTMDMMVIEGRGGYFLSTWREATNNWV